jgi:hypothetical protein
MMNWWIDENGEYCENDFQRTGSSYPEDWE